MHFCVILLSTLHSLCSFLLFPARLFLLPGPGHTVDLHLAALLTRALDPDRDLDPDPDPGLTLIHRADPALVHDPMAGPILARLIPDVTDAVMDGHGPDLVRGLMGTVALAHHDLLPPTGEEAGRGPKGLTGLGHDLAPLGHTGAAALVDESYLHASYHHMN